MKNLILAIAVSILFFGCKKQEIGPQNPFSKSVTQSEILVLNEGTFNFGNASLTSYNTLDSSIANNVFQTANNRVLGDVLQSGIIINSNLYLVVNNSAKIEVVDTANFNSIATITGFTSPRYIQQVAANKAYVSNLFSNNVQVVNLQTNTITSTINVGGRTEQMLLHNSKVYITKYAGEVLVLNPVTNAIEDTINVSIGCQNIVVDANNNLWVLCDGSYTGDPKQTKPVLYNIDGTTHKIIKQFEFATITSEPSKLVIDAKKENLLWLNSGVYKMNITDAILPVTPFIKSYKNNFYGLAIEPISNTIYVADAVDFVQKGKAYIFSETGSELQNFETGIAPNGFVFN